MGVVVSDLLLCPIQHQVSLGIDEAVVPLKVESVHCSVGFEPFHDILAFILPEIVGADIEVA